MTEITPTLGEFLESWPLFRDPVLSAGVGGLVLGFLSVYIVLRRMVFVSASVTQGAGLGVALSFFAAIHWDIELDPSYGAVALSLLVAGALVPDPRRIGMTRETMLGLAFAFTGGAAVLVGSRISQENHDIQQILFGSGVLVLPEDLMRLAVTAVIVMIFQLWWFNGLTFASFNPIAARVQRVPVRFLDTFLLCSIGVMIGVSARALGSLPVFALSTLPGTAAVLVARGRLTTTFLVASAVGAVAGMAGYVLAYFFDFPVGAAQTVVAAMAVAFTIPVRIARRRPATAATVTALLVAILVLFYHMAHRGAH